MSTLHVVLLIAVIPLIESLVMLARHRRVDAVGVFVLATLLVGAGIVLLGGSARLILAREQLLTGACGLALLGSLLLPQPLLYYLFRAAVARQGAAKTAQFDAQWARPEAREFLRRVTLVFGLGIVAEAAINIYLAYAVAIPTFLAVSPVVRYSIAGLLLAWFVVNQRRLKRAMGGHTLAVD